MPVPVPSEVIAVVMVVGAVVIVIAPVDEPVESSPVVPSPMGSSGQPVSEASSSVMGRVEERRRR